MRIWEYKRDYSVDFDALFFITAARIHLIKVKYISLKSRIKEIINK